MTCEEKGFVVDGFCNDHAGLRRFGKNLDGLHFAQGFLVNFGVARGRDIERIVHSLQKHIVFDDGVSGIYAEKFLR